MKQIRYTLYIMAIVMGLSACTRNDGNIGDWFGTWRVDSITIDGAVDTDYAPPYMFWKFQNSIVQVITPDDFEHTSTSCYGMWKHVGNQLVLDFDYKTGGLPSFSRLDIKSELNIIKLSRSAIELKYIDSMGRTIGYSLKKWG